ncbi:MAG: hypothetical protein IH631_01125 [Candidatus Thorarchaeota archaeon]|nr:hypothetical protein [Candidatus Thorarchaeota archaeon]
MPEQIELLSKYHELMNQDLNHIENGDTEAVFTLLKTDWVRILLVRELESEKSAVIDVEVSLPLPDRSSSYDKTPNSHFKNTARTSKQLLQLMMEHIQYILTLESSGFSVDLVGDGCLMVAYHSFNDTPDIEIFRLLQPPLV